MQTAQYLALHEPVKLHRHQSDNLSLHRYRKFAPSLSPRDEKLKKILIRARESREWGNNSTYEMLHAGPGRRQP